MIMSSQQIITDVLSGTEGYYWYIFNIILYESSQYLTVSNKNTKNSSTYIVKIELGLEVCYPLA